MISIPALAAHLPGAADAPTPGGDFRGYLFAAYGAVLLLLFLFTAWSVVQAAAAERRLAGLERRHGLEEKAREAPASPGAGA